MRRRRSVGSAANRMPWNTVPTPTRFSAAQVTAAGSTSQAYTSMPGTAAAIANPMAPEPQQTSTTTAPGRTNGITCATRNSVRRRGTNTPGRTATRRPQNSAHPSTCSKGTPDVRAASIDASSALSRAWACRRAASSSANTHPAARKAATSVGSTAAGPVTARLQLLDLVHHAAERIGARRPRWHTDAGERQPADPARRAGGRRRVDLGDALGVRPEPPAPRRRTGRRRARAPGDGSHRSGQDAGDVAAGRPRRCRTSARRCRCAATARSTSWCSATTRRKRGPCFRPTLG